ncbi:MAG: nitroreductase family protein [Planctomycetota bacterium]|jgi:nitroreductase
MDIYEAINQRFSVRSYKDQPVEDDKLRRVLDAGRVAPSGNNVQPWKFVVIQDADRRIAMRKAANDQAFVAEAPVVIAVVGTAPEKVMSCSIPGDPVDCAIAIDHMTLAAVAEGLGTCWIGAFNQEAARTVAGVPDDLHIVELLALGYPAVEPTGKTRKSFDEVVCWEQFS